jgi:hypothetical protein
MPVTAGGSRVLLGTLGIHRAQLAAGIVPVPGQGRSPRSGRSSAYGIVGVVNVSGTLYTVLDLAAFVKRGTDIAGTALANGRLLLLTPGMSPDPVALLVSKTHDIATDIDPAVDTVLDIEELRRLASPHSLNSPIPNPPDSGVAR